MVLNQSSAHRQDKGSRPYDEPRRVEGGDGRRNVSFRWTISFTLSIEGKKTNRMMTWLAWLVIALVLVVIVLNLWMMWQRVSDAARRPAGPRPQARVKHGHVA